MELLPEEGTWIKEGGLLLHRKEQGEMPTICGGEANRQRGDGNSHPEQASLDSGRGARHRRIAPTPLRKQSQIEQIPTRCMMPCHVFPAPLFYPPCQGRRAATLQQPTPCNASRVDCPMPYFISPSVAQLI